MKNIGCFDSPFSLSSVSIHNGWKARERQTKVVAMKAFISRLPFLRIFELSYLERKNEGEKRENKKKFRS